MATVYRNGIPPRRLPFKRTRKFNDMNFNEEKIARWARETLSHPMQYDFVVFNGSQGKLNREIEFTAWFQTKSDAESFQNQWKP